MDKLTSLTVGLSKAEHELISRHARATRRSRGALVREALTQMGVIPPLDAPVNVGKKKSVKNS